MAAAVPAGMMALDFERNKKAANAVKVEQRAVFSIQATILY
jgi:hypothetical protein